MPEQKFGKFDERHSGYNADELLRRNAASFTKTGTFCATCGAFGLGRNPQTKQHGARVDWESFLVSRAQAAHFARETTDHPMRRDHDMILLVETSGQVIIFQLCPECAVKEGVATHDTTIN